MIPAILQRRSVRKYLRKAVPQESIEAVLRAGMLAPSSKNRQPWKCIVVRGEAKAEMLQAMQRGLQREQTPGALLPEARPHLDGAACSLEIMRDAPAIIFVVNTLGQPLSQPLSFEARVGEICNVQSIGAAIENMSLAAVELGLGSLWICDIFFAYPELSAWLNAEGALVAALALGYAAEAPAPRPRKSLTDIVEWRN